MTNRNLPNHTKTPRVAGMVWLMLGIAISLTAIILFAGFASRPDDASKTLPVSAIDQASLDGPGWRTRPQEPSVVPEDVSGMDPAFQGILNYIRVHDAIPDYVILDRFKPRHNTPD